MVPKHPNLRDLLTRVQDLIAEEAGAPLRDSAQDRLERVLSDALGAFASSLPEEEFTSRDVSILIADLRGFSALSEAYSTQTVLAFLKPYFARMTEIIVRYCGAIDKFMSDSVIAYFDQQPIPESARRAVTCAVEMQLAMDELNANCRQSGLPELHMGVGINTGTVMAGLVGSGQYSEYVVIGSEVNLASRIEAFSLRGQILLSQSTYECCKDFALTDNPIEVHVKGLANPVSLHEVIGIPSQGKVMPRREIRRSLRVRAEIPFFYQLVRDKIVSSEPYQGTILDIGYYGVKAELGRQYDPYSEVKMDIDLSIVGYRARDIYAKILRMRMADDRYVASIEFTSLSGESQAHIRRFVQLLVQGSEGG